MPKLKIIKGPHKKGFFAYFFQVLHVLKNLEDGDEVYIDIPGWDAALGQPFGPYDGKNLEIVTGEFFENEFNYGLSSTGQYNLLDTAILEECRELTKKYIYWTDSFKQECDAFIQTNFVGKDVVAVHLRRGEHFSSGHGSGRGQSFETIRDRIYSLIGESSYDYLYVLANNQGDLDDIKSMFPNVIHSPLDVRTPGYLEQDLTWTNYTTEEIVRSVSFDVYLSSKANRFIGVNSNVSMASCVFRENNNYIIVDRDYVYA